MARSISSATFMAALMNWSNCWADSVTRSSAMEMDIPSQPPDGRKLVFVGDLVDRGPGTVQVLRLVSTWFSQDRLSAFPAITT